jgi:hypothetical protein
MTRSRVHYEASLLVHHNDVFVHVHNIENDSCIWTRWFCHRNLVEVYNDALTLFQTRLSGECNGTINFGTAFCHQFGRVGTRNISNQ